MPTQQLKLAGKRASQAVLHSFIECTDDNVKGYKLCTTSTCVQILPEKIIQYYLVFFPQQRRYKNNNNKQ